MNMKRKLLTLGLVLILSLGSIACGGEQNTPKSSDGTGDPSTASKLALEGRTLHIYCGAGMAKPFQDISAAFQTQTGCAMEVTYANAGQIQSQINTSKEGDLFVAGAGDEIQPVEGLVSSSIPLVKHIPVLAVQEGNPKGITGLADLTKEGIRVVLGDAGATPIGKIADKALGDAGILDQVNVVARTTTAPAIFTALSTDECDAAIVWKENVGQGAQIVDTEDMAPYMKTIPAASLSCTADQEALTEFLSFLQSDEAYAIWANYGYEPVE